MRRTKGGRFATVINQLLKPTPKQEETGIARDQKTPALTARSTVSSLVLHQITTYARPCTAGTIKFANQLRIRYVVGVFQKVIIRGQGKYCDGQLALGICSRINGYRQTKVTSINSMRLMVACTELSKNRMGLVFIAIAVIRECLNIPKQP